MRDSTINQTEQKENNLAVVLRCLMADRDCTRVKLAAKTGLAQATVTKIVSQLMAWGAVSEQESVGNGVGRRAIRLHLQGERYRVAAVRINRDNVAAVLIDLNGRITASARRETGVQESAERSMEKLKEMLRELIAASPVPVSAIGAAVPGPFAYHKGRITLMSGFPNWNRRWHLIDIRGELEEAFRLPVFVEHDANCGAMAEFWRQDSNEKNNLMFVVADMGIGAGMILDSRLYRGKDGFAGEIGHASIQIDGPLCECGNRGCLELYASNKALCREYQERTGQTLKVRQIVALVREDDPVAREVYEKTIYALSCGLVNIINIINPDTIVFSGRLTAGGTLFMQTMKTVLQQRLMPDQMERLTLRVSDPEEDPMLLGAGIIAFTSLLETPSAFFNLNK